MAIRRGRALALVAVVALTAAGCGGSGDSGDDGGATGTTVPRVAPAVEHRTLQVAGAQRRYRLFTPEGLGRHAGVPLVLALHGAGSTGDNFPQTTLLDRAGEEHGFLVAYPDAQGTVWNGGFCCTAGRGDMQADLTFLAQVIADVGEVRNLDPARVYVAGVSAGGVMAYRLGCNMADLVTGVASVAAAMVLDDCAPSRPLSVLVVHGTADPIVPFAGGEITGGPATEPAPTTLAVGERWASLDACPDPPTTTTEGPVTTTQWTGCGRGTSVRVVAVADGGHNWFAPEFGPPDGAIDTTAVLLEFFGLAAPAGAPVPPTATPSVPFASTDLGPPPS